VCQIEGTGINVTLDQMANAVIIDLGDEQDVSAKEVIRHLGSDALAQRTRDRLHDVVSMGRDASTTLILHLQGVWESWIEFDIRDAIKALLKKRSEKAKMAGALA
jgi:hypothetical protein